jgi:2-aminoadipate transaminase
MIDYDAFLSRAGEQMQGSAIRRMGTVLAHGQDIVSFAPGYPAPETFPWAEFQELARELLSGADDQALQYGPTRGHRPLIEAIAGIMARRGAPTDPARLLVTTGSQQGLDLLARVLLDPGDVVLVELPTYTGAITAFRNVQAQMAGVRQEPDGIDLGDLDAVHQRLVRDGRRVRVLYVVPNFQNPTGLLMSQEKRGSLLEWAARRNVLILEDDPYCELYFDDASGPAGVRPIRARDTEGRVVYLSSFSKTLAPGFRVAWIDAPAPLAARFEVAKQAEDLCTGAFDQRMVYEAVRRGILDRQAPRLRAHYRAKCDVMVAALGEAFGGDVTWPEPRGGFFLWATMPGDLDADRMLERAVRNGVIYVAGEAFFVNGAGRNVLRLAFSAPSEARIAEGVGRLARTVREEAAAAASLASTAGASRPAVP